MSSAVVCHRHDMSWYSSICKYVHPLPKHRARKLDNISRSQLCRQPISNTQSLLTDFPSPSSAKVECVSQSPPSDYNRTKVKTDSNRTAEQQQSQDISRRCFSQTRRQAMSHSTTNSSTASLLVRNKLLFLHPSCATQAKKASHSQITKSILIYDIRVAIPSNSLYKA